MLAGTQACTFDIKSFHRTCLVLPTHKPFLVAHFDGGFYFDHCFPLSATSASSNTGQIFSSIIDAWWAEMGSDSGALKYEDDACILHFPNGIGPYSSSVFCYRFDRALIVAPIDLVDVPWHPVKTGPEFIFNPVLLGFLWDLVNRRVSLPEEKRLKFLVRVSTMRRGVSSSKGFVLIDVQEIHRSLCHLCFIWMDGTTRLAVFSNTMAAFCGNTFKTHKLSGSLGKALAWWENKLLDPHVFRQLCPLGPLQDIGIYVDASTSWGVTVIIGHRWFAWRLAPDWKHLGVDICWLKSAAIELPFMFLEQLGIWEMYLLVRSNNKGAIGALTKG